MKHNQHKDKENEGWKYVTVKIQWAKSISSHFLPMRNKPFLQGPQTITHNESSLLEL